MSAGGRDRGPDRRWRPSDADRDRYAEAISRAFTDGRITVDDMQSRTALVYDAESIADLDAIVEDIPRVAPSPQPPARRPRPPYARMALVGLACAAGIAVAGASVLVAVRDGSADPPVAEERQDPPVPEGPEPVDVDIPEIDTELAGMMSEAGLAEMWEVVAETGVTEIESITVWSESAHLDVRSDTDRPGVDEISYEAGLITGREWQREYSARTEGDFFGWDDVTPEAFARAIEASPEEAGHPDGTAVNASIGRHTWEGGEVVISVTVEHDDTTTSVRWDVTASTVLGVY